MPVQKFNSVITIPSAVQFLGPCLKGSPCSLHGIEFMSRIHQPALREKVVSAYPVFCTTLHSIMEYQCNCAIGRADITLPVGDVRILLPLTASARRRDSPRTPLMAAVVYGRELIRWGRERSRVKTADTLMPKLESCSARTRASVSWFFESR